MLQSALKLPNNSRPSETAPQIIKKHRNDGETTRFEASIAKLAAVMMLVTLNPRKEHHEIMFTSTKSGVTPFIR